MNKSEIKEDEEGFNYLFSEAQEGIIWAYQDILCNQEKRIPEKRKDETKVEYALRLRETILKERPQINIETKVQKDILTTEEREAFFKTFQNDEK